MNTPPKQALVRFQNATHVLSTHNPTEILNECAHRTGWPVQYLYIVNPLPAPSAGVWFVSVASRSLILGGKGGFGTLLKGQSKQAGAKATTDFGACRDLQGRRLRHVNDELKLRKWKELKDDPKALHEALAKTPTGIYNWHLMTPGWADVSKKATRRRNRQIQRHFQDWQDGVDQIEKERKEREERYQQSVASYVQASQVAATDVQERLSTAITEGLQERRNKRKRTEALAKPWDDDDDDTPHSLCSLSGEVVVEENRDENNGDNTKRLQIQSKSDFASVVLVLDTDFSSKDQSKAIYYEVRLVTGGLAQIGWARMIAKDPKVLFQPNNDTGDGVGDDVGSFAYDGSRALKFHNGESSDYGDGQWKSGDVLGVLYKPNTGEMQYFLNGKDLGVAFSEPTLGASSLLFPAMSCNQNEILELLVREDDMKYRPKQAIPVAELLLPPSSKKDGHENTTTVDKIQAPVTQKEEGKAGETSATNSKSPLPEPKQETKRPKPSAATFQKKREPIKVEPLDLNKFESAADLEKLGLDRLKGALMAIQVKCGGTLEERAKRLFSLKGLARADYPQKVRAKNFTL